MRHDNCHIGYAQLSISTEVGLNMQFWMERQSYINTVYRTSSLRHDNYHC